MCAVREQYNWPGKNEHFGGMNHIIHYGYSCFVLERSELNEELQTAPQLFT